MKLRSMDIKGFRGLTELHLDFHQRLTVIVGENGIGKTSVLDALAILLDQYLARYVRGSAQKARQIKDSDINQFPAGLFQFCGLKIDVDVSVSEVVEWMIVRDWLREKTSLPQKSNFSHLNKYIEDKIQKNGFSLKGESLLIYYGQKRVGIDVPSRNRDSLGFGPEVAFRSSLEPTSLDFREFVAWFRDRSLLEAQHWQDNKSYRDVQLEAVRQAMEGEAGFSGPIYQMKSPSGLYIYKRGAGGGEQILWFNQLSSGEKTFLALAGDLARRLAMLNPEMERPLEGEGIVLIDEVELHLHPRWQRRFIPWLMETFPNCQFVVTTHSPQVLGEVEAECIRILRTAPKGALDALVPRETYGWDSNYILQSVLGADERSQEVKARLDDLENAISDGALDRAAELLAGLRRDIEGNPPELTIAQARLDRRQRRGDA